MTSEQFGLGAGGLVCVPRSAMSSGGRPHSAADLQRCAQGGQRVPQDDLAADLGSAGSGPRGAHRLGDRRAGHPEPHPGTYVQPISRSDIEDHYDIYGMIQGMAAARALDLGLRGRRHPDARVARADAQRDDPQQTIRLPTGEFHALLTRIGAACASSRSCGRCRTTSPRAVRAADRQPRGQQRTREDPGRAHRRRRRGPDAANRGAHAGGGRLCADDSGEAQRPRTERWATDRSVTALPPG